MGVAMVAVEKAMELAAAAAAAINQATLDYIRTSTTGRQALDNYTAALERSKQEIAVAIADTGLYQKAAESLTEILPQLTTEIIKGIGAIEDAITIYMEYKDVIDGVVGVLQGMVPGVKSVLTILEVGKVVWDGTVQVLDSVATAIENSTTELEEQAPAIQTVTSAWDRLTGAIDDNISSTIELGREYRATAAVSEFAGNLVGFFRGTVSTTSDELEENTRLQRENNIARGEAVKDIDAITQAQQAAEKAARSATLALYEFFGMKPPGPVEKPEPPADPKIKAIRDLIAAEQEAAERRAQITAVERAETDARHEEFRQGIEERFELLNGYTVNFEDLTTRQIAKLNQLDVEEARVLGNMRGHTEDMAAGTITALAGAAGAQTSALDAVKQSVGGMLVAKGTEAIFSGTIKSAQLNPMGVIEIGAGIAAVAAGTSLGGGGGGGASPSVPPSTTPGSNQTTYTNVSMGFVGDRRAASREVADVNRNAMRRGL
jgi:hypothetical protein